MFLQIFIPIFALFMAIFIPTVMSSYFDWIREGNTPELFQLHPYLPMTVSLIGIVVLSIMFVILAVREYYIMKNKKKETPSIEERIKSLEELHKN